MKKLAIVTIVLSVLVSCLTAPASAGPTIDQILSKKELVVGTSATYPPLTFKTKGGVVLASTWIWRVQSPPPWTSGERGGHPLRRVDPCP
jgi:ABC-type amino acid transport substrate-binding protein